MTAELLALSNELVSDCVAVPQHGPDVCPICRGRRDETEYLCESCTRCEGQLSSVHRVLPITLYAKPSAMRDRLRCYKDSEDTSERRRVSREIAALVHRFFREHGDYLAGRYGQWDVACIVPSTTREPPHPLRRALTHHAADVCAPLEVLLRRGSGEIAHRKANPQGFEPVTEVAGRRVLILDDVLTTGARSQSAAHALQAAGAKVPLIVVVARRINPDWRPETADWWARKLEVPFSWLTRP